MKQTLKELLPFIISAAEVAAKKCGCTPEDVLKATISLLEKRKKAARKESTNRLICQAEKLGW